MNYIGEMRVRSVPNIIRRNARKFEKIDEDELETAIKMENRSNSCNDVAIDAASVEPNDDKSAARRQTVGRNCRRRKQDLRLRDLCEEDIEWEYCTLESVCEDENRQNLDAARSSFDEPTTDNEFSSANQLYSEYSSLEFFYDEETEWLDVQSSVEVDSQEVIELITDSPPLDEIDEAPVAAKRSRKTGEKKLKAASDFLAKENRDPPGSNVSEVRVRLYCCWICDKRYTYRSSLRYHKEKIHAFDDRMFETAET